MARAMDAQFPISPLQISTIDNSSPNYNTFLLLVLIHSTIDNYDRREASRETWAARNILDPSVLVFYFIPEKPSNVDMPGHRIALQKEYDMNRDIIVTNFTHSNEIGQLLIPSSIWIEKFCPHVSYILNIYDNSVIDFVKLLPLLHSLGSSVKAPLFMCDFMLQRDSFVVNSHHLPSIKHKNLLCHNASSLTTPAIWKKLSYEFYYHDQTAHRLTTLQDLCHSASVSINTELSIFSGSQKKPPLLKELMKSSYTDSDVMVAINKSPIRGRENVMIRQTWHLMQAQYRKLYSIRQEQERFNQKSQETGSIVSFAVVLMLIDFSVVFIICSLILCKRQLNSFCGKCYMR